MTSSFLQHKAGPGCITYDANMAILQIATQIMRDYLEQQKNQTVTAQECTDMAYECLIKMGKLEFKKAVVDSLFKAAGGVLGMAASIYCIKNSRSELKTLGETNTSLESLDKVKNQMEKPLTTLGAATAAPAPLPAAAPAPLPAAAADRAAAPAPLPAPAAAPVSVATVAAAEPSPAGLTPITVMIDGKPSTLYLTRDQLKKDIPDQVEEWCKGGCKGPLAIKLKAPITGAGGAPKEVFMHGEDLNGLQADTKDQLRRTFQEHRERLSHISQQASLAVQNLQNISQIATPLTQVIEGIGGLSSMDFALRRSKYEAAKSAIQSSQEVIKQVDAINSQGAQQSLDQAQKALQAYMSVVSANTRA